MYPQTLQRANFLSKIAGRLLNGVQAAWLVRRHHHHRRPGSIRGHHRSAGVSRFAECGPSSIASQCRFEPCRSARPATRLPPDSPPRRGGPEREAPGTVVIPRASSGSGGALRTIADSRHHAVATRMGMGSMTPGGLPAQSISPLFDGVSHGWARRRRFIQFPQSLGIPVTLATVPTARPRAR